MIVRMLVGGASTRGRIHALDWKGGDLWTALAILPIEFLCWIGSALPFGPVLGSL